MTEKCQIFHTVYLQGDHMENNARNLPEVATGTVRDAVNHFAPRYDNQCYQLFTYYLAKNQTKIAIFQI